MNSLAALTQLIKKNGAGIVALALIFMMVYSWFPKVEKTLDTAIQKMDTTLKDVTKEFREEMKEQRNENRKLIDRLISQRAEEAHIYAQD